MILPNHEHAFVKMAVCFECHARHRVYDGQHLFVVAVFVHLLQGRVVFVDHEGRFDAHATVNPVEDA